MGAILRKFVTKTIGKEKHTFEVEGEDFHSLIMESQNLSFPDVKECGLCGSDDLTLGAHVAQNKHDYVHITCKKCRGYVNFGKQQENPSVYFLRLKKDDNGNNLRDANGKTQFDWQKFVPREERK
jgi:predicted nucleic-acid-binding Zn-ribbon protein